VREVVDDGRATFVLWFVLGRYIERRGNTWTTWEVD
jgi:hypothetical protein